MKIDSDFGGLNGCCIDFSVFASNDVRMVYWCLSTQCMDLDSKEHLAIENNSIRISRPKPWDYSDVGTSELTADQIAVIHEMVVRGASTGAGRRYLSTAIQPDMLYFDMPKARKGPSPLLTELEELTREQETAGSLNCFVYTAVSPSSHFHNK
jgi:hypothetical protein